MQISFKRLFLFADFMLCYSLLWIHFCVLCQQQYSLGEMISQGQLIPFACLFSDLD